VSAFAAASPAHLRLVLGDAGLVRAWLALPASSAGQAFVLHAVARALCPRLPVPGPPQPPLAPGGGSAAFAGVPLTAPDAHTASVAAAAEASGGVCSDTEAVTRADAAAAAAAAIEADAAESTAVEQARDEGSGAAAGAKAALFTALGKANGAESTMALLVRLLRAPISETRHGAYDVLRAVACAEGEWGIEAMVGAQGGGADGFFLLKSSYAGRCVFTVRSFCCRVRQVDFAGFFDFMEDRFTEFSKEGKEWKFAVIEVRSGS